MFNPKVHSLLAFFLLFVGIQPVYAQYRLTKSDTTFVIDNIHITGNKKTKKYIILREIELKKGDTVYLHQLLKRIKKSSENLMNRSLFNSVEITPQRHDFNKVDLYVVVTERWYIWPIPILTYTDRNFNVWWETKEFSRLNYGVNLTVFNFGGRMQTLNVLLQGGYDKSLQLSWEIPYINKKQKWGVLISAGATLNHETDYELNENKLDSYHTEKAYSKKWYFGSLSATFRPKYYYLHTLTLSFDHREYADTLLKINPEFAYTQDKFSYLSLEYNFKYDFRDYVPYPLKGFYAEADIKQDGLGLLSKEVNMLSFYLIFDQYLQLHKRWYFAYSLAAEMVPTKYQPYFLQKGLGYKPMEIRGYQLYLVGGNWIGQIRSNVKFAIIPKKTVLIPFIKTEKFNRFFYGLYANLFFDAAYVASPTPEKDRSFLNNKLLYGVGVGIDFVTYYDVVIRAECVLNRSNQCHFFLSFVAPI